jgi:hypothetical protein
MRGQQEEQGGSRWFFQCLEKRVGCLGVHAVRIDNDPDLVSGIIGFQMQRAHHGSHLVNGDDARLGFRAYPLHVTVLMLADSVTLLTCVAEVTSTRTCTLR